MNHSVEQVFRSYPENVKSIMMVLRNVILDVASKLDSNYDVEETLKWGEPSYLLKGGSTVRIGWKETTPECVGLYFNCNTKLVDTFRTIYSEALEFEGNRAIIIDINSELPQEIIRECIKVALTYHMRKKLPLLGI